MSHSLFLTPHFQNEEAAYRYVESRLWPKGPVCPHCGSTERISMMKGKATRIGLYKCYACRKQFTVKIGTIFEDSHVPLYLWLHAIYLMCSSKKGVSSNQLHRTLGVTLKTAWFMSHRIREAMRQDGLSPFGSRGGAVEADETFLWDDPDKADRVGVSGKNKILSLVDRRTGSAKSAVIDDLSARTIIPILKENIGREARLITDDAGHYNEADIHFAQHHTVNHSIGEYVSFENPAIHTNTVEGYFSIFKRGMKGVYQHCAKKHMHRYLAEFDFRYNARIAKGIDDPTRTDRLLKKVVGKRLTYETTNCKRILVLDQREG